MEIIQEIGSYAGFAAVLGLAVLSALYFSQARDVKRLREWAGRAPERVPPPVQPQRVVAQPIAKPGQPTPVRPAPPPVPRPPGPQPATPAQAAAASAAGAAPAVAKGPAPATPAAGSQAPAGSDSDDPAEEEAAEGQDVTAMDTVVHPPPQPLEDDEREDRVTGDEEAGGDAEPAGDGSDESEEGAEEDEGTGEESEDAVADDSEEESSDTGEWRPEDEHSDFGFTDEHDVVPATPAAALPRPPQPPRPFPRREPPPVPAARSGRGERTTILPPYSESRPAAAPSDGDGRSAGSGRRSLLAALAALVVVAVGVFAVLQLTGGDDSGSSDDTIGLSPSRPNDASDRQQPAIDPSTVTVAVLNGTTVPGLAATLGDQISGQGFKLGTVTNNFDQERAESVVLYAPGAENEATAVARRLDIPQREPIDPDSQALAGDATVVVVAGADQTQ